MNAITRINHIRNGKFYSIPLHRSPLLLDNRTFYDRCNALDHLVEDVIYERPASKEQKSLYRRFLRFFKNVAVLVLTMISFEVCAQDANTLKPINSFFGMPFGSSKEFVKKELAKKGGKETNLGANTSSYSGLRFSGRQTYALLVYFNNDKLYGGSVVYKPTLEPKIIELYDAVVEDITKVYGPSKKVREFKTPFKLGDGYELTALKGGYAKYEDSWQTWYNEYGETGGHISVTILVELDDLMVGVNYFDPSNLPKNSKSDY